MKSISFIFIFVVWANILTAQISDEYDYFQKEERGFSNPINKDTVAESKTSFGVITGASIGMFSGRSTFSNTFIAPHVSYSLSSRLNVSAAAVLGKTQFYNGSSEGSFNQPGAFNSTSLMVGLDYKISKNFSIGAAVQMSNGLNPFQGQPGFNRPFSPGFSPFMPW